MPDTPRPPGGPSVSKCFMTHSTFYRRSADQPARREKFALSVSMPPSILSATVISTR